MRTILCPLTANQLLEMRISFSSILRIKNPSFLDHLMRISFLQVYSVVLLKWCFFFKSPYIFILTVFKANLYKSDIKNVHILPFQVVKPTTAISLDRSFSENFVKCIFFSKYIIYIGALVPSFWIVDLKSEHIAI